MSVYLKLGPNRVQVDTVEIGAVELSYKVKDIYDYGKRNCSFSKPITILKNKLSDSIFQGLHNINIVNGYNIGAKLYGEIVENGVPILVGSLQVIEVTPTTYECILFSNNVSLFTDISDKLIVGNPITADDVVFTGNTYDHLYDVSIVRNYLKNDPSNNGRGLMYAIMDFNGGINYPQDIEDDYPLTPALSAKHLFDAIFAKAGYTYTISDDISTLMNKMYIPFNGNLGSFGDVSYGYYFLGDPCADYSTFYANGNSIILNSSTWNYHGNSSKPVPYGTIRGYIFNFPGISHVPQVSSVSGGYDLIRMCPSEYHQNDAEIILPCAGTYIIDVSLRMYNWSTTLADVININAQIYSDTDPNNSFNITENLEVSPITNYWVNASAEVTVTSKASMYIYMTSNRYPYSAIGNANTKLNFGKGTGPGSDTWESSVKIAKKNYPYAYKSVVNLNTIRPQNYKQSEFINDILTMFNSFIEVDPNDEHLLHIKSYTSFYQGGEIIDWSRKVDSDTCKFESIKNTFPNQQLGYTEDTDLYNQDFRTKYPFPFGSKTILNDSEFVKNTNEITLKAASTIMKKVDLSNPASPSDPSVGPVEDSISLDTMYLVYDQSGTPIIGGGEIVPTSSGTWYASLVDTGHGTSWVSKLIPTYGASGVICTILLYNNDYGYTRSCKIRFTCGTVQAECDIIQYDY